MTLTVQLDTPSRWKDYALIDCGDFEKLERFGEFITIRPEPQAMWAPASADWKADGEFIGGSDEEGGGEEKKSGFAPQARISFTQ